VEIRWELTGRRLERARGDCLKLCASRNGGSGPVESVAAIEEASRMMSDGGRR
jgi:hypothetical protein